MPKKKIVEHEGHRLLLQSTKAGKSRYSMFKYVNGEQLGIADVYDRDTDHNRDIFITEALAAFDRARAAPFN